MKSYDAMEIAYKNGYKQGIKDYSERLLKDYATMVSDEDSVVFDTDIYNLAKEMIGEEK